MKVKGVFLVTRKKSRGRVMKAWIERARETVPMYAPKLASIPPTSPP